MLTTNQYDVGIFGAMGYHSLRDWLIAELERDGINTDRIFNPQVARGKWNAEHKQLEDRVKKSNIPQLYILGSPSQPERKAYSSYGIWQTAMSLLNPHVSTLICLILAELDEETAKSYRAIIQDIQHQWPDTIVEGGFEALVDACVQLNPQVRTILGGTAGQSTWAEDLIAQLEARGMDTTLIDNPFAGAGKWSEGVQILEDRLRSKARQHVYCFTTPLEVRTARAQVPAYTLLELAVCLNRNTTQPQRIAVYCDIQGMEGHGRDVLTKIRDDLHEHFPCVPVFADNPEATKQWLKARLQGN